MLNKKMKKKIKKILFLTGTRADFGKIKPLILRLQKDKEFNVTIFVTGMHMLEKYGETHVEVNKSGIKNIYKYINQNYLDRMDTILAKTIFGFSDYIKENKPDLIIVHGDRVEALAGAMVGALNNIQVGHLEGGEVSGTVDEVIRHAITKLVNFHFVSNKSSFRRVMLLGEPKEKIYIIGSADIDIMKSNNLPSIRKVRNHYKIPYKKFGLLLFHPVTTEVNYISKQTSILLTTLINSNKNFVVIYPNNDHGTDKIFEEYKKLNKNKNFRMIPSMRFEYFLTTLKNSDFIIGNSSAGIREAPYFGVPTINVGTRQHNRSHNKYILNVDYDSEQIISAIKKIKKIKIKKNNLFGDGNSVEKFYKIIKKNKIFWTNNTQKYFTDHKLKLL
jgi:UDP-N-acetylglucosamine 2-epimerase (hydrolysing)